MVDMLKLRDSEPAKNLYEYSWQDGDRTLKIQLYAGGPEEAWAIIESLAANITTSEAK